MPSDTGGHETTQSESDRKRDDAAGSAEESPTIGDPLIAPIGDADTVTIDTDVARTAAELNVGDQIGPYRLLEVVGYGGFGVVYLAEQRVPIRRRVAVKVIKPGMDSSSVLARFEAERNALSVMDHPNIARVLDGGTTKQARPYFVMEYVPGESIAAYCQRKRLSLRERLELFGQVCQAVQHAHTKGVIHRDLKPSNILVREQDDAPVVKVIDFGVAKALDQRLSEHTLFTAQGHIVGTPEYMAPEQAEGSGQDIDTRADVYSLGVVLYELLTGERPFDLTDVAWSELTRVLSEVEPPRPSTRILQAMETVADADRSEARSTARALRNDLDWVVMKCLEKDRSRRYQTAAAVADDLERFLAGEPLQAGPPTTAYRLSKFARKHRGPIGVVAMFAIVVAAMTVTSVLGWSRAATNAKQAELARDYEANLRTFLVHGVLDAADTDRLGPEVTVIDAVLAAIAMIESNEFEPATEAGIRELLARVLFNAGRDREGLQQARLADDRYTASSIESDEAYFNRLTIAAALSRFGRHDEAEAVFAELVPDAERRFGAMHGFTLAVRGQRATDHSRTGDYRSALAEHEDLARIRSELNGPDSRGALSSRISAMRARIIVANDLPKDDGQRASHLDESREIYEGAIGRDEQGSIQFSAASLLMQALGESGNDAEAIDLADEWLALTADSLAEDASYRVAFRFHRARSLIASGDFD
ncbi:MAG: serine/threonine-protein kinase, partial [Planctomycetota bacterium]